MWLRGTNHMKVTLCQVFTSMSHFPHRETTLWTVSVPIFVAHTELFHLPSWPLRPQLHPASTSISTADETYYSK